ncbi:hypothetical protein FQR65_LT13529 [Abscondita terminalis]|nr:hypothetical protein FQR65_LT13529 [Abscondita terminalis]
MKTINREDLDITKRKSYRVCEIHFSDDMKFKDNRNRTNLVVGAVPNMYLEDLSQVHVADAVPGTSKDMSLDVLEHGEVTYPEQPAQQNLDFPERKDFFLWMKTINREDLDITKRKSYRVCEIHFSDDMKFKDNRNRTNLVVGAVPNMYLEDLSQVHVADAVPGTSKDMSLDVLEHGEVTYPEQPAQQNLDFPERKGI